MEGPQIIFILFIVFILAMSVLSAYLAHKRREEMKAWAESYGLRYEEGKDFQFKRKYPQFACLSTGNKEYAYNICFGDRNGCKTFAFDYHYETYSTDSKGRRQTHHHYFSAVIMRSQVPLQPLVIRPEGFFDKVKEFFGANDIDFESAEFSRCFYVQSPNKQWAFDVIHQATMEFLLGSPRFSIEFNGKDVIAYRNKTFSMQDFDDAIAVISGIVQRLPNYLIQELQGRA